MIRALFFPQPQVEDPASLWSNLRDYALWLLLGEVAFMLCTAWMPGSTNPLVWVARGLAYGMWSMLVTLIWAGLQQYSAWFFSIQKSFGHAMSLSLASARYYSLMLWLSLPLVWLWKGLLIQGHWAVAIQVGLLLLNGVAAWASVRLFAQFYQASAGLKPLKSWGVALFPIVAVVVLYSLTQVMAWVAVQHKV